MNPPFWSTLMRQHFPIKQRQIILGVKEDAHQIALQLSLEGQYCQRNIVKWSKHYRNQSWNYQLKSIYRIHQPPAQNMRQTINLKEERLCLILDNSSIHLSKDVEDYFKRRMCSWIYFHHILKNRLQLSYFSVNWKDKFWLQEWKQ